MFVINSSTLHRFNAKIQNEGIMIRTIINLIDPAGNTNKRIRLIQIPGYNRGGIMCVGEVSIPCQPVISAAICIFYSGNPNNPHTKSVYEGLKHPRQHFTQSEVVHETESS
jgi:hypothetical protein